MEAQTNDANDVKQRFYSVNSVQNTYVLERVHDTCTKIFSKKKEHRFVKPPRHHFRKNPKKRTTASFLDVLSKLLAIRRHH